MNYYEEVKLPRFNKDSFYRELIKLIPLMQDRTSKAKGWKSLDLKLDNKNKRILTTCTVVEEWINKISFSTVYVAILEPKGYIDWHVDQKHATMSKAINLYIKTDENSFIEFNDKFIWKPEEGKAYKFRADIRHRVINGSKNLRMVMNLW
tara:strand:+ start:3990 stop:4439 length:450 start_codon:yes stop_codon:yes gene_type:complete